jgi:hypothetical protein
MDPREIAILKDKILKQLSDRTNKRESLTAIYTNLNDNSIPIEAVGGYVKEMEDDGAVRKLDINYVMGTVFIIEPEGEKILFEGGYVKLLEKKREEENRIDKDLQRKREKEELEIKHLKWTKWLSIIAIGISVISLVFSIFKK